MFEAILIKALWLVLLVSGIPVVAGAASGLIISIIQAATQIQEQSISYVVKVTTVVATLVIFSPWFAEALSDFFKVSMLQIVALGSMP